MSFQQTSNQHFMMVERPHITLTVIGLAIKEPSYFSLIKITSVPLNFL